MGIIEITRQQADIILDKFFNKEIIAKDLFLFEDSYGTRTAIDNSTGDCWTENFKTKQEAIDYLEGKNPDF